MAHKKGGVGVGVGGGEKDKSWRRTGGSLHKNSTFFFVLLGEGVGEGGAEKGGSETGLFSIPIVVLRDV